MLCCLVIQPLQPLAAQGHLDTRYVAELMAQNKVTVNLFAAPRLGWEWLKRPEMKASAGRLRLWASGGELVPSGMLEKVFEVRADEGAPCRLGMISLFQVQAELFVALEASAMALLALRPQCSCPPA